MPTYEYYCLECHETWQRNEHIDEHDQVTHHTAPPPRCPHCDSERVEPVFSPFYARTSRKY